MKRESDYVEIIEGVEAFFSEALKGGTLLNSDGLIIDSVDLMVFKNAILRFFKDERPMNAFDVYYAFDMIFGAKGKDPSIARIYLEELGKEEKKILYSLPIFHFALGLALYASSEKARERVREIVEEGDFIREWGEESLFGGENPYELPGPISEKLVKGGFYITLEEYGDHLRDRYSIFLELSEGDASVIIGGHLYDNRIDYEPEYELEWKVYDKKPYLQLELAKIINAVYMGPRAVDDPQSRDEAFSSISVEYKFSNILQAKAYNRYAELLSLKLSDRRPRGDSQARTSLNDEELDYLSRLEHIRWCKEKFSMGWRLGDYKDKTEREEKRLHKNLIPYDALDEDSKAKDRDAIKNMIPFLGIVGVTLCPIKGMERFPSFTSNWNIGTVGHRDLSRVKGATREGVFSWASHVIEWHLIEKGYMKPLLLSGFADGSDLIVAEAATFFDVPLVAVLPTPWREFRSEISKEYLDLYDRMMALTYRVVVMEGSHENGYKEVADFIVDNSRRLLFFFDGRKLPLEDKKGRPINIGGTYYAVERAKRERKRISIYDAMKMR